MKYQVFFNLTMIFESDSITESVNICCSKIGKSFTDFNKTNDLRIFEIERQKFVWNSNSEIKLTQNKK